MSKLLVLAFIFIAGLTRWSVVRGIRSNHSYLIISLFVQTLPFGFGKAFYVFLGGQRTIDDKLVRLGEFDNAIRIEMPFIFMIFMFIIGYHKFKNNAFNIKHNKWFYALISLCFVSFLNYDNQFSLSFLPMLIPIIQFLLLFKFIEANFSQKTILQGIFDGLMMIAFLQFILTICYPILGMESVGELFRGDGALEWSQRRGMKSAIGTFGHPAHLSYYCVIMILFFTSCFCNNYQKKKSLYLIFVCTFILFLTLSRTSIFCGTIVIVLILFIKKYGYNIFSIKYILSFSFFIISFILFIYLSPWGYLFFESESEVQIDNRVFHWLLGYQIWENAKLIGVGINTHVYYMLNNMVISADIPTLAFFLRSPIHNIHIIILAEVGIFGFIMWLYFLYSSIKKYSKNCNTYNPYNNIFNLTFIGILFFSTLYGFFGWSPFILEVYSLCFLLGYFASDKVVFSNYIKKSKL